MVRRSDLLRFCAILVYGRPQLWSSASTCIPSSNNFKLRAAPDRVKCLLHRAPVAGTKRWQAPRQHFSKQVRQCRIPSWAPCREQEKGLKSLFQLRSEGEQRRPKEKMKESSTDWTARWTARRRALKWLKSKRTELLDKNLKKNNWTTWFKSENFR